MCVITSVTGQQPDTLSLQNVDVVSHYYTSAIKGIKQDKLQWDINTFDYMPQMLGGADPLHYTQLLPGVQTSSEQEAGIHIQGCEDSHNSILLDDVLIYNPKHLFGLFSVFNASHFRNLEFSYSPNLTDVYSNRLGGKINLKGYGSSWENLKKIEGEMSVGLISTQGTIKAKTSKNSALIVSGRTTYLNLLYSQWLKVDDMKINYRFSDYNLTWGMNATDKDKIWIDLYGGKDNLGLEESDDEDIKLYWQNSVAGLHWLHSVNDNTSLNQNLFFTKYRSDLYFNYNNRNLSLPASIEDFGYNISLHAKDFNILATSAVHSIMPQAPMVTSRQESEADTSQVQRTTEFSVAAAYNWVISEKWSVSLSSKSSLYSAHKTYWTIDPSILILYSTDNYFRIKLHYGWRHQFLFQTGFTTNGMPTEFWISSGYGIKPQYAQEVSINYYIPLWNNRYALSSELYYKDLQHQIEYTGGIYDFFTCDRYNLSEIIKDGKGWNFGLNLMLNKQTGNVTGWLSYSLGRSLRQFYGEDRIFPSSHERIQEGNLVINWKMNENWIFSATGIIASGTPFTAPKYFYIMNERLLTQYDEFNANRLPLYKKVDASICYSFSIGSIRQSVNFSVYNCLYSQNPIYYRLKFRNGEYGYKPMKMISFPLPSISYNLKF